MPKFKNVKLLLTDDRTLEYDEADVQVQPSGVVMIAFGDVVSHYSPSGWACLDYDKLTPGRPRIGTV